MIIRESYGEDIADTETDISEDDDEYEDALSMTVMSNSFHLLLCRINQVFAV